VKALGPCSTICRSGVAFQLYVPFDLMVADGEDVRSAALKGRRACWPRSYAKHGMQQSVIAESIAPKKGSWRPICDGCQFGVVQ
jgi:hypothetical protein